MTSPLLEASLSVGYAGKPGVLREFELTLRRGEIFALAGPSGCGKSTFALAILRLLDPRLARTSGTLRFSGRDLLSLPERQMRALRGREIALVPQSPIAALNPCLRVGSQIEEAWNVHSKVRGGERAAAIAEALTRVSLDPEPALLRRYPRELSVGMAQRVLIAMAILHRPSLLIADEATSALDPITQSGVLTLFRELNQQLGASVLFITHDLAAAASVAHRLGILHQGAMVECGPPAEVISAPTHPYAQRLIAALPRLAAPSEAPAGFAHDLFRLAQGTSADTHRQAELPLSPEPEPVRVEQPLRPPR